MSEFPAAGALQSDMAKREPPRPSAKLQALLKEFQNIAGMSGYLTHVMDAPQMRMIFTLYGRVHAGSEAEAAELLPGLQAWSERISLDLREGSSSAVLPPQILIGNPQPLPNGQWYLVATLNFSTKITDASYLRVRTAVLKAYQRAVALREGGLEAALAKLESAEAEGMEVALGEEGPGLDEAPEPPLSES